MCPCIRRFSTEHSKVYTEEDANLALAFANQAAAALQSARLHTNAVVSAARDERLRLARDLHDSVSQAMFGINMGARTASHLLPPDSPARPSVEYVLNLSHIAQAELRALLLEMRPDAIHTEGLLVVLRHHIDAKAARSNSSVTVDLGTVEPPLSLEGKEMIYRVCIEALNNALKYAQASQIIVHIQVGPTCTDLDVRDNGIGFDTTVNFPDHFGLKGMRERAEKLGAVFHISSTIGAGTHASLRIQHEPQLCTR
jgi:signal transduction histidine kinase